MSENETVTLEQIEQLLGALHDQCSHAERPLSPHHKAIHFLAQLFNGQPAQEFPLADFEDASELPEELQPLYADLQGFTGEENQDRVYYLVAALLHGHREQERAVNAPEIDVTASQDPQVLATVIGKLQDLLTGFLSQQFGTPVRVAIKDLGDGDVNIVITNVTATEEAAA